TRGSPPSFGIPARPRPRIGTLAATWNDASSPSIRGATRTSTPIRVSAGNTTSTRWAGTASPAAKVPMRTSVSGISTDARLRRRAGPARTPRRRAGGFTLLELLVVVTIIGLLAGAVVLSTGNVRADRDIEREARRLSSLIELVREEAIMQS